MNRPLGHVVAAGWAILACLFTVAVPAAAQDDVEPDTIDRPPPALPPVDVPAGGETVRATPGEVYPAGGVHRFFFGDLNRELWRLPIEVPVLDLDAVGGGLEFDELSGGKQTLGLRFEGADGQTYQFRSIVKTPSRALPPPLRSTTAEDVFQDQMAAQFPLSAMVVAEFLEAVEVLVAKPRPVVMPDDPRLGEFRELFAGRMGWIEIRPNEGEDDTPGFAGSSKITGSDELLEELLDDPNSYVDQEAVLRARLIDMLVGDWDRHFDQWRWARFDDGIRQRWSPIPRDRDWAFARIDGVLPSLVAVYAPKYVGFGPEYPPVERLHWSAQGIDRRFLNRLDRETFLETARFVRERLNDAVIDSALALLPPSYAGEVERLRPSLRARRDALVEVAGEFHDLLADQVDVFGTEEVDSLHVSRSAGGTRVTLHAPEEDGGILLYDRVIDSGHTDEVRVYLRGGDDRVTIEEAPGVAIHVVPAGGDDVVDDRSGGQGVHIYSDDPDDDIELGPAAFRTDRDALSQDSLRTGYLAWDSRDWGSSTLPRPAVAYDSDQGPYLGAELVRYGFGFGHRPHRSRLAARMLNGFGADDWRAGVDGERALGSRGWWVEAEVDHRTRHTVRFHGVGNETPGGLDDDDYRTHRHRTLARLGVAWRPGPDSWVRGGIDWSHRGAVEAVAALDPASALGADTWSEFGAFVSARWARTDRPAFPRSGIEVGGGLRFAPAALDVDEAYGRGHGEAAAFWSPGLAVDPTISVRIRGATSNGAIPFFRRPDLGGADGVAGLPEGRYVGDRAAAASVAIRVPLLRISPVTDLEFGVHGVASSGRVWSDGERSGRWHDTVGGGVWLFVPALERGLSLTLAGPPGGDGLRAYVDFGRILP